MAELHRLTWDSIQARCLAVAEWSRRDVDGRMIRGVHGIPRGGCVPGAIVTTLLGVPLVAGGELDAHVLVVDDLVDSGRTAAMVASSSPFAALYRKSWSPRLGGPAECIPGDPWLVFPWEVAETPGVDAVLRLAQLAGLDTSDPRFAAAAAPWVNDLAAQVRRRLVLPDR